MASQFVAAPPVGTFRWREPQSMEKWTAVRQADTAGPSCIQMRGMALENVGHPDKLDEDCHYLNVFSPHARRGARSPAIELFPVLILRWYPKPQGGETP